MTAILTHGRVGFRPSRPVTLSPAMPAAVSCSDRFRLDLPVIDLSTDDWCEIVPDACVIDQIGGGK
ncbi:hypothetical protein CP157_01112 [Paracoccus marcusii]|uniref:hypothetical protein n=1 Tax=Paracoccus marcusii TaxID=59779 RepID=UPI001C3CEC6A|nr:hypothetical protein [Paracoccus marcusii]QXI63394.1 hypothetical protein CP157_01112 [Paracoccus marcusii]